MYVPGHDGRRGFGGACFPKDIDALIKYGKLKKNRHGTVRKYSKNQ